MKYLFLILLLLCCNASFAQNEKSVLFVGNSLTFYNDMPQMLQKMFDENKIKIKVDQITAPGITLAMHATYIDTDTLGHSRRCTTTETPTTVKKILGKKWDFVVLQEATLGALIPQEYQDCTEPAVVFLDSIIRSIHAKTLLYQAYAEQKFPVKHCHDYDGYGQAVLYNMGVFKPKKFRDLKDEKVSYCTDSFRNTSEEFNAIKGVYKKLSAKTRAEIAEVGLAYEMCKAKYPELQLYTVGDHPSPAGSYFIACVFFKKLTNTNLKGIKYSGNIDDATAQKIREVVDSTN